jgi:DNA-binding response OmpR family regulator
VSKIALCPYCRSPQPMEEFREGSQLKVRCQACGVPIESGPRAREGAASQSPTILCIDDDRLVLSVCSDALEWHGFRPLTAPDGPAGIETAKKERPDLILLDIMMPGMTGFEVCQRLRAEPEFQATPIILLTALSNPNLGVKGKEVGATTTMRKPFGTAEIVNTVERILGRKGRATL